MTCIGVDTELNPASSSQHSRYHTNVRGLSNSLTVAGADVVPISSSSSPPEFPNFPAAAERRRRGGGGERPSDTANWGTGKNPHNT